MYQKIRIFRKYFFKLDKNIFFIGKLTFWGYWYKHRIGFKSAWRKAEEELKEFKSDVRFSEVEAMKNK